MSKIIRAGGKYTGNHKTLIPLSAIACDIVNTLQCVTKISAGFIKGGAKVANGHTRVKLTDLNPHCLLLLVQDKIAQQKIHIYVTDIQVARTAIARKLRDADIAISFTRE